MSRSYNRSLGIALRRLRMIVIACCWVIALSLATQIIIWSLSSFTDLRYREVTPEQAALIIQGEDSTKPRGFITPRRTRDRRKDEPEMTLVPSAIDTVFGIVFSSARAAGLIATVVVVPLVGLGVVLGVPAGAPNVDKAVTAMTISIVFVTLALPLGGWFGLAWEEGTLATYERLATVVEGTRENGFTLRFWTQFLALPAISVLAFIFIGFRFSAALEAVILKSGLEDVDPEIEKEASNVKASSLHGTGRTAGALKQAMKKTAAKKGAGKKSGRMTELSAGDMPRRLI